MAFEKLSRAIRDKHCPVTVGLDPAMESLPAQVRDGRSAGDAIYEFNRTIIDAVADIVPAVKPQSAFYERWGIDGMAALRRTIDYAAARGLYVILDAKRGDIGSTAAAYADAYLSPSSGVDALTVNGYLGFDGVKPFLDAADRSGKAIFVLCRTSNPSASDFQDLDCGGRPLYRVVGEKIAQWGENEDKLGFDGYSACGAVVGATYPEQLTELRAALPQTFFLIPGYGAQGGTASDVVRGFDAAGGGAVVNSSRGIIAAWKKSASPERYADAARAAAIEMRDAIAAALKAAEKSK